jgi:hypothetical protein
LVSLNRHQYAAAMNGYLYREHLYFVWEWSCKS